jgi:hypothetical protein
MSRWRTAVLVATVALSSWYCARRDMPHSAESLDAGSDAGSQRPTDAGSSRREIPDVSFTYEGSIEDAALLQDAACAVEPVAAEPVALDLYLMLDRSASMPLPQQVIPTCMVGDTIEARWCYAINALAGFFGAPTSNGMGVALQFFPHGDCGWTSATEQNCCTTGSCCTGTDDAIPTVPLGQLPGQQQNLVNALNAQSPLGTTTPIEAALRGLVSYTAQAKQPNRSMVAVLVTDGEPNGCDLSTSTLGSILATHRLATGIKTFIIGMDGANFQTLEQLAVAGGATPHTTYCASGFSSCSFFNVGGGKPEAFIDALQQIQRSVVGCRFALPSTDAGIIDPDTLVVNTVSPANPDQQSLKRLPSAVACGDGWYSDPMAPGEFALCPGTCSAVQAQLGVRIELLAGCLGS